ncbi:hypothetical protein B0H14DRAFT_3495766 [Mycena olivaceomarginata]|nr:hypothetical protein B0H14DRAFT_3495766 [Mycena olivaceomarginata]
MRKSPCASLVCAAGSAHWACNRAAARRNATSRCRIDEATEILATLRDDIVSLWEDPDVHDLLQVKGVCIEDRPGLCIVHLSSTYIPSDNNVVLVRLHTMGVQEWRIRFEQGASALSSDDLKYTYKIACGR